LPPSKFFGPSQLFVLATLLPRTRR